MTHKWTKKQVESAAIPNYSKLYVIKPALLKLLGNLKRKKLLELGCGNGFWLRILNSKGAVCTGIDKSKNQLEKARVENIKRKINISYNLMDISNLRGVGSNRFDVVLLEKVLLEVPNLSKIRKILKEAFRVTKKGGFVLVSELHPVAVHFNLPNVKPSREYSYFKSGSGIKIASQRAGKGLVKTYYTDYHWTFEDLCNAVTDAGYKITAVSEPRPSESVIKKYPYLRYRKNDPLALMIRAVK